MQAFRKWLSEGAKHGKYSGDAVEFKAAGDAKGNGVFIKSDKELKENDLALEVPLDLCLYVKFASEEDNQELNNAGVALPEHVVEHAVVLTLPSMELAMGLIHEMSKGEASFYAPYLAVLPRTFETIPLTWSVDELQLISRDINTTIVLARINDVCLTYCHLVQSPEMRKFVGTFENFLWAVCVVNSRQNPLPGKAGNVRKFALVPAFDMCNHDPSGVITTDFSWESKTFLCHAHKTFSAGQEFTIYYGPRPDLEFLLYSGFVCSPPGVNENSALILPFFIKGREYPDLAKIKQVLVKDVPGINPTAEPEFHLLQIGGDIKDRAIRLFARAAACTTREEAQSALKKKLASEPGEPIELEEKEKDFIRQTVTAQKHNYLQELTPAPGCRKEVVRVADELRKSDAEILDRVLRNL